MTDDKIIEKTAIAIAQDWPGGLTVFQAMQHARAALAAARPIIRAQALDEAERKLLELSEAMFEKAESIRSGEEPFALATVEEKDAAIIAGDFVKAAAAIRALKENTDD